MLIHDHNDILLKDVEAIVLHMPESPEQLEEECQQVSAEIQDWLNEEWTPLEVHSDLATASAQVSFAAKWKFARRSIVAASIKYEDQCHPAVSRVLHLQ